MSSMNTDPSRGSILAFARKVLEGRTGLVAHCATAGIIASRPAVKLRLAGARMGDCQALPVLFRAPYEAQMEEMVTLLAVFDCFGAQFLDGLSYLVSG